MKLTKNFRKNEFDSKDGATMPCEALVNVCRLANQLQVLRNKLGKPIIINSGYRSPSHNKRVGGAKHSQHLLGNAADIRVQGMTPKDVVKEIEKLISSGEMMQGGIGVYRGFVHYDIRGIKARW